MVLVGEWVPRKAAWGFGRAAREGATVQPVDLLHCCTARRSAMRAPLKAFDVVGGSPRVR